MAEDLQNRNPGQDKQQQDDAGLPDPAMTRLVSDLAQQLAVSKQDVRDAMEQVGQDPKKIEEVLRGRENSY